MRGSLAPSFFRGGRRASTAVWWRLDVAHEQDQRAGRLAAEQAGLAVWAVCTNQASAGGRRACACGSRGAAGGTRAREHRAAEGAAWPRRARSRALRRLGAQRARRGFLIKANLSVSTIALACLINQL